MLSDEKVSFSSSHWFFDHCIACYSDYTVWRTINRLRRRKMLKTMRMTIFISDWFEIWWVWLASLGRRQWLVSNGYERRHIAVREQEYNQQQQQIKHAFQCKSISAYRLHRAKKKQGTFLCLGRYTPPVACVFFVKMKNLEMMISFSTTSIQNLPSFVAFLNLFCPTKLISLIQGMVDERFDSQAHFECPFLRKH